MPSIDLTIDRLGIHGEGVARHHGLTIFVEGALPQERVRAKVVENKKTFARAKLLENLLPSPDRIQPACSYFGECGGCQLMHLTYSKQLEAKQTRVKDALQRIGKIEAEVSPCIPSNEPFSYRNKIQLSVDADHRLGLYARTTHDLVPISKCAIHCPLGEKVLTTLQKLSLPTALKHVLIKTAVKTGQVLVILVTKTPEHPTVFAKELLEKVKEIKGVVQNVNPSNETILGTEFHTLAGQGWIEEELSGLMFKVSPASFFQVNPSQAEALYAKVGEFAELRGTETVLDAYSGVGTLSLILANSAKAVIGIESNDAAVNDAKENAEKNQICNAHFLSGRAEEKIAELEEIDVAILNPPRIGCERSLLEAIAEKKPQKILYVSCDPATLARDLNILIQKGYRLTAVQPFDMFPQTMHVETVALLTFLP
jgi:23S rRNA (uracil1939-C5)-methyltransferase